MPIDITLPIYLVSLLASILTELAKYIPFIKNNDIIKALVAVILVAAGVIIVSGGNWTWGQLFATLIFALANYKIIIQPVAGNIGLATQK